MKMKRYIDRPSTSNGHADLLLSIDDYVSMLDLRLKIVHAYQERSIKDQPPLALIDEWSVHQPIP